MRESHGYVQKQNETQQIRRTNFRGILDAAIYNAKRADTFRFITNHLVTRTEIDARRSTDILSRLPSLLLESKNLGWTQPGVTFPNFNI